MMNGFFITGTDTGVGKTLTSAILTYVLKGCYWKPIQSGVKDEITDAEQVKQLTDLSEQHFWASRYFLQASLSPDQAAGNEGVTIDVDQIKMPSIDKPLIVEGAGGIYVPLNNTHLMLDLMKKFALPIIIVTRGTLGTINHTLLTIESLRKNNLIIHGVVFNGELKPANQHAIEKWGHVRTLFHIPVFDKIDGPILRRWIYDYTITA